MVIVCVVTARLPNKACYCSAFYPTLFWFLYNQLHTNTCLVGASCDRYQVHIRAVPHHGFITSQHENKSSFHLLGTEMLKNLEREWSEELNWHPHRITQAVNDPC
jgi:hypothetical protein